MTRPSVRSRSASDDTLGMIGLFPPLVHQVLATGAPFTVLRLRDHLAGPRAGWHVTLKAARESLTRFKAEPESRG